MATAGRVIEAALDHRDKAAEERGESGGGGGVVSAGSRGKGELTGRPDADVGSGSKVQVGVSGAGRAEAGLAKRPSVSGRTVTQSIPRAFRASR